MKIHCIGIEEQIVKDLAVSLAANGFEVTSSSADDDAVNDCEFDSGIKLINKELDKVIIGRQVDYCHEELREAQRLGIPIYSYSRFITDLCQDKQRIVFVGEIDAAAISVLVIKILDYLNKEFDYVVDSNLLENTVRLTDAPVVLLLSDERDSSVLDEEPQCITYNHNIALISDLCWQPSVSCINIESYASRLNIFADNSPKGGTLVYYKENILAYDIGNKDRLDVKQISYLQHEHIIENDVSYLVTPTGKVNCSDIITPCTVSASLILLNNLGIKTDTFYRALNDISKT